MSERIKRDFLVSVVFVDRETLTFVTTLEVSVDKEDALDDVYDLVTKYLNSTDLKHDYFEVFNLSDVERRDITT